MRTTVGPALFALVLVASGLGFHAHSSHREIVRPAAVAVTDPADPAASAPLTVDTSAQGEDNGDELMKPQDVPADDHTPCADFARAQAEQQTTTDPWICLGNELTTNDPNTGDQSTTVLPDQGDQDGQGGEATDSSAAGGLQTSLGALQLAAVVDAYHANKTVGIGWSTGSASGWINYTYNIALYNHSATVKMHYWEKTGKKVIMTWRLRIRHDIDGWFDDTVFTYPDVLGALTYTQGYTETEDRYGDGYNKLPYEKGWKVFWDSYDISIRYAGTNVYADNTAQSDRATCYKTVSCKFL